MNLKLDFFSVCSRDGKAEVKAEERKRTLTIVYSELLDPAIPEAITIEILSFLS